jgi:hypothetical protein
MNYSYAVGHSPQFGSASGAALRPSDEGYAFLEMRVWHPLPLAGVVQ